MAALANIYLRGEATFVLAAHRTVSGFWIDDEHVLRLATLEPQQLGDAVFADLGRSETDLPDPVPPARFDKALLEAAGVKSFAKFMDGARLTSVRREGDELLVTHHRNLGPRGGFEPLGEAAMPTNVSAAELGQRLIALLLLQD